MANIRWGYAVNQWRNMETDLARKDQVESALKVISVSGFEAIEMADSDGILGGPEPIVGNFGSARCFNNFLNDNGINQVCSFFMGLGSGSLFTGGFRSTNPSDHKIIIGAGAGIAGFMAQLGAERLLATAMPAYAKEAPITDEKIKIAADCWSNVGKATLSSGVKTAVHVDFLNGLRNLDSIEKFLEYSNPETVGLAMDTAEFTIAGIDPVKFYEKHHARVNHLHFKDAIDTDSQNEYKEANAELEYWPKPITLAGQKRGIERWYYEMGTPGGLVDFPALLKGLHKHNYEGWIVVESDQSPHVEESVMLNGWYQKRVLAKV